MKQTVSIGIIGDYNPKKFSSHPATNEAIGHAAKNLNIKASAIWVPTPSLLAEEGQKKLGQFDAVWASSGSPYLSLEGALRGIRLAREANRPFFGT